MNLTKRQRVAAGAAALVATSTLSAGGATIAQRDTIAKARRDLNARIDGYHGPTTTTPPTTAPPRPTTVPPTTQRTVPDSIAADCSRPVEDELNSWLATVPNGSLVLFRQGGCYLQGDGSFQLVEREGIVLDGRGSTFKATTLGPTQRAVWRFVAGRNLTVKNMIARGVAGGFDDPRIPRDGGNHVQHAFSLESTDTAHLLDLQSYNVDGDPVSVGPDRRHGNYCTVPPSRHITVERLRAVDAGRTISVTHGEDVTFRDSYVDAMQDSTFDLETDDDCMVSRNVQILNNRIGRVRFAFVANTGVEGGDNGGGVTIIGNVMERVGSTCYAPIHIDPAGAKTRSNYIIRDNTLRSLSYGVNAGGITEGRIENNTMHLQGGCGIDSFGVALRNSSRVNVSGNTLVNGPHHSWAGELSHTTSTEITAVPSGQLPDPAPLGPEVPDTTPPNVTITEPAPDAPVSGTVRIGATIGGGNVLRADFYIDGVLVKTDHGPNYAHLWDTAQAPTGPHQIEVRGVDSGGNVGSASRTVVVKPR